MEKLISAGSNDTPIINLDHESGLLFFGGSSLPENVFDIYQPVTDWLDKYIQNPNKETFVEFSFEYLNTASSQMIMQIMEKFVILRKKIGEVNINWYYDIGDGDMRDFGEELSELSNLPINLISKEH